MTSRGQWGAALVLLGAAAASAAEHTGEPSESLQGRSQWRAWAATSGGTAFNAQRSLFDLALNGGWYLTPLLNDGSTPFGLLAYRQHPDQLELTLAQSAGRTSVTLGGQVNPWPDTGISGAVGAGYHPAVQRASVSGSLHFYRYFFPNVRGTLGLVGSRESGVSYSSLYAGGRTSLSVVVGRLLLSTQIEAGNVALATSALVVSATVGATLFLSRRWAVAFQASYSPQLYSSPVPWRGPLVATTVAAGAGAEWFLTSSMFFSASYTLVFRSVPPGLVPLTPGDFTVTASLYQTASVGFGVRL